MGNFLSELSITPLDDGIYWRVNATFEYHVGDAKSQEKIEVPIGFLTDLGSVPRLFWNIIPPIGKPLRAYVLHDFLYATQIYTRSKSDEILMEAMGVAGVSFFERWAIFLGVRSDGWKAWKEHARERKMAVRND